jgi:hypothetical protein
VSWFRSWVWMWIAGLLLGIGASPVQAGAAGGQLPTSEQLLPDTTTGFVAVSSVDELANHWRATQLGQLMADPVMQPFAKDLRRQFEDRWSGARERLGLTLDDLRGVPGGDVGVGLILQPASDSGAADEACLALVVDVTGHVPQATALLEKVSNNLKQQGANRTEIKLPETTFPVVQFDHLPRPKDDPLAKPGTALYVLSGNLLVASDSLRVIRGILARASGDQANSLASVPAFKAVMSRCARDNGGAIPQIRWFIQPMGYVAAIRAATPEKHRRKGKSILELLSNQGFGAIQGVGGFVDFYVTEEYQLVHRTAVYAPRRDKYEKAMKMLAFPDGPEFAPQRWVPRDVATYTTFYVDILNAFDNFGPLFNEICEGVEYLFSADPACQGELDQGILPQTFRQEFQQLYITLSSEVKVIPRKAGSNWEIKDKGQTYLVKNIDGTLKVYAEIDLWEEALRGLKNPQDPLAPQIDLRADLIEHLGQRVTVISAYEEPITTTSERLLFAIETTNEEAVRAAIKKTMQTDPDVRLRKFEDFDIWEIVEEARPEEPTIPTITIPTLAGEAREGKEEKGEKKEKEVRLLPHAAVTVAKGHLFVASHIDFLKKVLTPRAERDMLVSNVDCQLVESAVKQLGVTQKCAWSFSRTDEEYRPTYELIRQGKMPQSETMLARVLNAIFATGKKGEFRHQKIDGTQMPQYDVVRRYLGSAGMAVSTEPEGWFFKGFTLRKGAP